MARLNLYKKFSEESDASAEVAQDAENKEMESNHSLNDIPQYIKEGPDLNYSTTYYGNSKGGKFFSTLILVVIVLSLIAALLFVVAKVPILDKLQILRYRFF